MKVMKVFHINDPSNSILTNWLRVVNRVFLNDIKWSTEVSVLRIMDFVTFSLKTVSIITIKKHIQSCDCYSI